MYLVVHLKFSFQEHIQNSVKNQRWSFMQKLREIFSKMKIISCNIYILQFFETARWEQIGFSVEVNLLSGSCSITLRRGYTEIFLSDYFMKHSGMYISLHLI